MDFANVMNIYSNIIHNALNYQYGHNVHRHHYIQTAYHYQYIHSIFQYQLVHNVLKVLHELIYPNFPFFASNNQ